jgi:transmembrane 9 superfamily protein 1
MHMLAGGFLPFTAISVELYYVFLTLWGRHLYTLYGILSAVFVILLVVTACVSIMFTYFQLSMYARNTALGPLGRIDLPRHSILAPFCREDYRWWWRSMLNVGYVQGL